LKKANAKLLSLNAIAIEKLRSSIIINNKGELLFPENDFGKRSEARNRLLADLLARTDFMEKAGTGIKRVTDACSQNNNEVTFDFTDSFWVTIKTNIKKIEPLIEPLNGPLNKREMQIVNLIKLNNKITIEKLAINTNASKATIKRDIAKLKELKILMRMGSRKNGYWVVLDNNK